MTLEEFKEKLKIIVETHGNLTEEIEKAVDDLMEDKIENTVTVEESAESFTEIEEKDYNNNISDELPLADEIAATNNEEDFGEPTDNIVEEVAEEIDYKEKFETLQKQYWDRFFNGVPQERFEENTNTEITGIDSIFIKKER